MSTSRQSDRVERALARPPASEGCPPAGLRTRVLDAIADVEPDPVRSLRPGAVAGFAGACVLLAIVGFWFGPAPAPSAGTDLARRTGPPPSWTGPGPISIPAFNSPLKEEAERLLRDARQMADQVRRPVAMLTEAVRSL